MARNIPVKVLLPLHQSLRAEDGSGVVHPPGHGITLRSTTLNSVQRSRTIVCCHRRHGFHDGGEGARAWELLLSLAGSTRQS